MRRSNGLPVWWLPGVLLLGGIAIGGGCDEAKQGQLDLYWSLNGQQGPSACTAVDVDTIRILTNNAGTDPDPDPSQPTWDYVDVGCAEGSASLTLPEGLHRVRLVALDGAGQVRSQVVELLGVQVVDGAVTSVPRSPGLEPPIDLEVPICGDGVVQTGEWCDATDLDGQDCTTRGFNSGTLACNSDCTFDDSQCETVWTGIEVLFAVRSADASASSCAAESIVDVEATLRVAGVGTVVDATTVSCATGTVRFSEPDYGLYTVVLEGRDAAQHARATGTSEVVDYSSLEGPTVHVDLVALP